MPPPRQPTFVGYLKSFGPGIVTVLTWLSAGDVVAAATAGGNYGYALMWAFSICILVRCLFVSLIAKYQLCNVHGETVIAGLSRIHRLVAPLLFVAAMALSHAFGVYLLVGGGDAAARLLGMARPSVWAVAIAILCFWFATGARYRSMERVFMATTAVLACLFVGLALVSRPSPAEFAAGVFGFAVPEISGQFDAELVLLSLIGAIGGGLPNFIYPYFAREKGWTGPEHRRVQQYDILFSAVVLIVLDLSVWIVGAETTFRSGGEITDLDSLASTLGVQLGSAGKQLFYLGILSTIVSTIIGISRSFAQLAIDASQNWRPDTPDLASRAYTDHPWYPWIVAWATLSPLAWLIRADLDFVLLSLLVNAAQVILVPLLVLGVWYLTSSRRHMIAAHRNRLWEQGVAALLLLVGCVSTFFSARTFLNF